MTAPIKTVAGFKLKNNRVLAKVDGYFFLSFFTAVRMPKMIVAIKEPKLIISPNASATDKRLLLSSILALTSISTTTSQKIATIINFTVAVYYNISCLA